MKLLTYYGTHHSYTYYLRPDGAKVPHGPFQSTLTVGSSKGFHNHGALHGEYKRYNDNGEVTKHYFYFDWEEKPGIEMNAQEKLLFQIQNPGFRFLED